MPFVVCVSGSKLNVNVFVQNRKASLNRRVLPRGLKPLAIPQAQYETVVQVMLQVPISPLEPLMPKEESELVFSLIILFQQGADNIGSSHTCSTLTFPHSSYCHLRFGSPCVTTPVTKLQYSRAESYGSVPSFAQLELASDGKGPRRLLQLEDLFNLKTVDQYHRSQYIL